MVCEGDNPSLAERVPGIGEHTTGALEVEERVEGVPDRDEIEGRDGDTRDRYGHVSAPYEPIPLRAIGEGRCAVRDGGIQPPVVCAVGSWRDALGIDDSIATRRIDCDELISVRSCVTAISSCRPGWTVLLPAYHTLE